MSLVATGIGVAVRTAGSPLAQVSSIRRALSQINSQQVMYNAETMDGIISDSLAARRFSMILLGHFCRARPGHVLRRNLRRNLLSRRPADP